MSHCGDTNARPPELTTPTGTDSARRTDARLSGLVPVGVKGFASLEKGQRVLLLQGPNGPFFKRLRHYLETGGAEVWKVNFNLGDDLFHWGPRVLRFNAAMTEWPAYLAQVLSLHRIDSIVVFGAYRRHHRIAARIAKERGITFWVFEEGYFRPDYITLEPGGVNADSVLATQTLEGLPLDSMPPRRRSFRHAYGWMAWFSFCYFAAGLLSGFCYPRYRHHKPFRTAESLRWMRSAWRKIRYRFSEREAVARLLRSEHEPFYVVALQVHNDSQIRVSSPWRHIEDFIEWTMFSFAHHAPAGTRLVIKHHPMDRGHVHYGDWIARCEERFGIVGRVDYLHDIRLPTLLQHCCGVVTVNSTLGLQALHHGAPVIALGRCFYARPGVTFQGPLDQFWSGARSEHKSNYLRWRNFVVRHAQINSSFYADRTLGMAMPLRSWVSRIPGWVAALFTVAIVDASDVCRFDVVAVTAALARMLGFG